MKFNNYTGTGSQEIIFMKKAIREIKKVLVDALEDITSIFTALGGKQEKFSKVTTDSETGNKTLSPEGENKVILSDDFEVESASTAADSNNIVNVSMLRNYHDSSKQDTLTPGQNISIQGNVISSSGGGEVWRDVFTHETTQDESSVDSFYIDVDNNGQPFSLSKAKIFILIPQGAGDYNGYFGIRETDQSALQTYGAVAWVSSNVDIYNELEIFCNENYPVKTTVLSTNLSASPASVYGSFGTSSASALLISSFSVFQFWLNNGTFPVGTKIILKGVDAIGN